jgi:hypothetical protein
VIGVAKKWYTCQDIIRAILGKGKGKRALEEDLSDRDG